VSTEGEASGRGARRRSRLAVACLALAALFGSGIWRLTGGAPEGSDGAASRNVEQSALRSAGLPADMPQLRAGSSPGTRYDRLAAVDWKAVPYPMDCGGRGTEVVDAKFADVDRDRAAEAVVLVRCSTGAEHRPTGLFVYDGEAGQAGTPAQRPRPRLRATLLKPADRVAATHIKVTAAMIKASGSGYSSASVPACCPDETIEACWRWNGSRFTRVG
jgi:hypothetical protein